MDRVGLVNPMRHGQLLRTPSSEGGSYQLGPVLGWSVYLRVNHQLVQTVRGSKNQHGKCGACHSRSDASALRTEPIAWFAHLLINHTSVNTPACGSNQGRDDVILRETQYCSGTWDPEGVLKKKNLNKIQKGVFVLLLRKNISNARPFF